MHTPEHRCGWAKKPLEIEYHDKEWGVPIYNDQLWFEFVILEAAQAGMSWNLVLTKREGYRQFFFDFDPQAVANLSDQYLENGLTNPNIIRNRLKVFSARTNAQQFLKIQEEFGSFNNYMWQFVDGKPMQRKFVNLWDIPSTTPESDRIAKDLKKRGFKFFGSTTCYAMMQGAGMTNDHLITCFRHQEVQQLKRS